LSKQKFDRARLSWLLPFALLAAAVAALWLIGTPGAPRMPEGTATARIIPSPTGTLVYRMARVRTSTPTPRAADLGAGGATPTATWVPTLTAQPASQITPGPGDVPRIASAEAWAKAEAGEAVFVDVRVEADYERGHLPGAVSLPPGDLDSGLRAIPKDKVLIFYCA
jgi:hypothetical protein